MKICIVHTMYYPYKAGGAEITVQQIAEGLVQRGHKVVVVSTGKRNDLRWHNGVKIYEIKLANLYWPFEDVFGRQLVKPFWHLLDAYNPVMAARLGSIIDNERPDFVQTHNLAGFSVAVWRAVKKRGLPVVQVLHDYYNLCVRSTMYNNWQNCTGLCTVCRLYRAPNRVLSGLVDVVVGVSRYVLGAHTSLGLFPNAKKLVIHNGYTLSHKVSPGRLGEKVRFGYIGRLHPTKGLDMLIDAFLAVDRPDTELIIAGEGESGYVQALRHRAHDKPVRFLGYTSREKFFPQIDILVVPSIWHDPFPGVCKEALAWGKPLIASRRGGIPEMVVNGETGWLFEPEEPSALEAAMRAVLIRRDEYEQMSAACIARAELFKEENMVDAYDKLYN